MFFSRIFRNVQKGLDWVDVQSPWRFFLILYLLRWLIIIPMAFVNGWLFPNQDDPFFKDLGNLNLLSLSLSMLILNPIFETIIECSIPYWIIHKIPLHSKRPWLFIFISATLMAILHPIPTTTIPSLITGFFLAYTYGHFALQNSIKAVSTTMLFHSCINLVGFILIVLGFLHI